jgi:hypothetical protein
MPAVVNLMTGSMTDSTSYTYKSRSITLAVNLELGRRSAAACVCIRRLNINASIQLECMYRAALMPLMADC